MLAVLLTTSSGPGYTTAQRTPASSIGGFASTTPWAGGARGDLYGMASSVDVENARPDYRCVYLYNDSYTDTILDVRAYLDPDTAGALQFVAGADPRPVTFVDSTAAQAVEPLSAYQAPSGVTFSAPSDYATGIQLGDLPPRAGRPLWFKRVPVDSADRAAEAVDVTFTDGGANDLLRRVAWMTEGAAAPTAPYHVPLYVPTSPPPTATSPNPNPFRRVGVDFVTDGYARVTWDLDKTLTDDGPYLYQLQCSQSGVKDASDWVDVGPPEEDATFLVDPTRRLWGVAGTLNYRVVLTTASYPYVSMAANVYGLLDREQWLTVREVFRKEEMMLRRFTGIRGYLLKAKRYGTVCPSCTDPVSFEVRNSNCAVCYGLGFTGGYHPPVPFSMIDIGNEEYEERVAYNEGLGTVADNLVVKGRALARLPVVSRDVWVAQGSDRRYHVHKVATLSARLGYPIVFGIELRQAPKSDVLYSISVPRPDDEPPPWKVVERINL